MAVRSVAAQARETLWADIIASIQNNETVQAVVKSNGPEGIPENIDTPSDTDQYRAAITGIDAATAFNIQRLYAPLESARMVTGVHTTPLHLHIHFLRSTPMEYRQEQRSILRAA
ncbi:hypothetical protein D7Y19_04390 [Stenotrophomonas maltophilia]|jgi:hypothetical protein|nr:hypothetical protein [Stenotrophomonas maltophilia]MBA0317908.1 hypothetical protein [Stenotrophomonas maltophilia]